MILGNGNFRGPELNAIKNVYVSSTYEKATGSWYGGTSILLVTRWLEGFMGDPPSSTLRRAHFLLSTTNHILSL